MGRLTHIDDPERIEFYRASFRARTPTPASAGRTTPAAHDDARLGSRFREQRLLVARRLLPRSLAGGGAPPRARRAARATRTPDRRLGSPVRAPPRRSLSSLHARYTRARCIAALGISAADDAPPVTGGTPLDADGRNVAFFVDLQKAERDYSPTTMYQDYAINRELFHWESQSTQTPSAPRSAIDRPPAARPERAPLRPRTKTVELGTQPVHFLGP